MIKVLFFTINLGGGGAERVLVNLVNHMDKTRFDITVETMFVGGVNAELLEPHIHYICRRAPFFKGITQLFRFIPERALFRYFIQDGDYDIIIAYMHGSPVKVIAGCRDKKTRKVAWLHNGNPESGSFFTPWFSKKRAIKAYASMDQIVGVSRSVSEAFVRYTGISEQKVTTKYNTNDTERILTLANEPFTFADKRDDSPVVCSVGGLSHVKGYDRLIRATARLHNEGVPFYLAIVGKGPDEGALRAQIAELQAENYIRLLGFQKNPYNIMKNADVFISSSRTEGLATVLTEALTVGLPVVSTDVSGAKEVLGEHNEYGLVVENSEEGIYEGLKQMLLNCELRDRYAANAVKRSQSFDTDHTVKEVDTMLRGLVCKN